MAISRTNHPKAPNQKPVDFFECKQFGGARGLSVERVPEVQKSGPVRERIWGRPDLGKK